jgi:hypothetical protein
MVRGGFISTAKANDRDLSWGFGRYKKKSPRS